MAPGSRDAAVLVRRHRPDVCGQQGHRIDGVAASTNGENDFSENDTLADRARIRATPPGVRGARRSSGAVEDAGASGVQ